jgi:hypothetical protein
MSLTAVFFETFASQLILEPKRNLFMLKVFSNYLPIIYKINVNITWIVIVCVLAFSVKV